MITIEQCMELLTTRHSVRHYTDKQISRADLQTIATAGTYAPSAMNRQTWRFTVTQNKALIAELAAAIGSVLERDNYDLYLPNALIITSNLRDNHNAAEDNACALQNMFLAAHALGIGTVWINQLKGICDDPRIRPILDRMQIPSDHVVCGMCALGYVAGHPRITEKDQTVIHFLEDADDAKQDV